MIKLLIAILFIPIAALGIGSDIGANALQMPEQASEANPPSGSQKLWVKTDHQLYLQNSSGTATSLAPSVSPTITGASTSIKKGNCFITNVESDIGNSGASLSVDMSTANLFTITLNSATPTITLTNFANNACPSVFVISQDSGGNRVPSFAGASIIWTGGSATFSNGSGAIDLMSCVYNGAISKLMCNLAKNYITANFTNLYSISLNGSTDYVSVPASPAFALGTTMSVSAWIKPSVVTGSGATGHGVVEDFDPITGYGFLFSLGFGNAGDMSLYGGDASAQATVNDTTAISANVWTHVATTYDGANAKFYINGALSTSPAYTVTIGGNGAIALHIGASTNTLVNRFFTGLIDEVAIWNATLSGPDVASIYNAGSPGNLALGPQYGSQIAWWRFENDTTDMHGNHNGTPQGSPTFSTDVP